MQLNKTKICKTKRLILIIKDDTFKQPDFKKIPFLNSNSSSFVSVFCFFSFYLNPSICQISKINVSRNTLNTSLKRTKRRKEFKRQGYQRKASFNFNMNKQEGTKNPETAWSKQTKVKVGKQKHGKWLRLDDQEKLHKNNITSQWLRIKLERNKGDEHTVGRKQVE